MAKKERAIGLKMLLLDQQQGGAVVLRASQGVSGLNIFASKLAFEAPSGQQVAFTSQGLMRSASKVEFQGRKYK